MKVYPYPQAVIRALLDNDPAYLNKRDIVPALENERLFDPEEQGLDLSRMFLKEASIQDDQLCLQSKREDGTTSYLPVASVSGMKVIVTFHKCLEPRESFSACIKRPLPLKRQILKTLGGSTDPILFVTQDTTQAFAVADRVYRVALTTLFFV